MMRDLIRRYVFHPLEAALLFLVFAVFRLMPVTWASALGGFLGRTIGPGLGISRRAKKNIARAFPNMAPAEVQTVVHDMWDNLGRMVAEYPNMGRLRFSGPGAMGEVVGEDVITQLRDDGKAAIFVSGHIANWEAASAAFHERGLTLDRVYRMANNPLVERLYRFGRSGVEGGQIPKGPKGARAMIEAIADGRHIAMLVDQKMNNGIPVPFFGRDAMTAPAAAELALKYDCPLVPVRTERLGGAHFRITVFPPLELEQTGDRQQDATRAMTRINQLLELWIIERPGQWLWLHNRWPD